MNQPEFQSGAATTYEQVLGSLSRGLAPRVCAMAGVAAGQRVLDVASGTGIVASAALDLVGATGHVAVSDIAQPMLDQARGKFAGRDNVSFHLEDGSALSFPDRTFDAATCGLGLMFFNDPAAAVRQFYRVLRSGGGAAVSVNPNLARSLVLRVMVAIGRHTDRHAKFIAFDRGEERLRGWFTAAGFRNVETAAETLHLIFESFEDYFGPTERGAGIAGQEYLRLSDGMRAAVRAEVREGLDDRGGPVTVAVDVTFAGGRKQ
jgi:SAM-dependent methyltransferase